jgi:hypothetical protein
VPIRDSSARGRAVSPTSGRPTCSSSATRRATSNARWWPAPRRWRWRPAVFSVQDLRQSGAEIVFEDLSDTKAFLELLE